MTIAELPPRTATQTPSPKTPAIRKGRREIFLPVGCIVPDPHQPRVYFRDKKVKWLAGNITKYGLKEAVKIRRFKDPDRPDVMAMIVDGQCRLKAHELANLPEIRAIIVKGAENADARFTDQIIYNFHRSDHTPLEIAWAIKRFDAMGKGDEEIAGIFGHDKSWIAKYRKLLKLCQEIWDMMDPSLPEDEQLKFPVAVMLCHLPHNLQISTAKQIISKRLNMVQAKTLIRKVAADAGITIHGKTNSPDQIYFAMERFANNTATKASSFVELPDEVLEKVGFYRSDKELRHLRERIKQAIEDLKGFDEVIAEAQAKNN